MAKSVQVFFVRFGALCVAFEGDVSLLEGTLLHRFACGEDKPDIVITLLRGELPEAPPQEACVYESVNTRVFSADESRWHRRFSSEYAGVRREYAALTYGNRVAQLTVAPICENTPHCVETCIAFEHLALCAGALPLHASHVRVGGESILFTAASGVGKSTQAALWEQFCGAEILNGDKALIQKTDDGFIAAGIPYCGTSAICLPGSAPLRAVIVLEQAMENTVARLTGASAAARVMAGVIRNPWHTEDAQCALELVSALISEVPVYLLRCLPEESAVRCLRETLRKERAEHG